jgi:deoxyxylulose-5-phosphate synthase
MPVIDYEERAMSYAGDDAGHYGCYDAAMIRYIIDITTLAPLRYERDITALRRYVTPLPMPHERLRHY